MWRRYSELLQNTQELYAGLLGEIAQHMLIYPGKAERKRLKLNDRVIYNPGLTGIRFAFATLMKVEAIKPFYPKPIYERAKGGTPYGRLRCNAVELSDQIKGQPEKNHAYLEEVLDAYLHLLGGYGGLNVSRGWFDCEKRFIPTLEQFRKCDLASRNAGKYRWSDNVAHSMWRTGIWNHTDVTERETRLLFPLTAKLAANTPEEVVLAIEDNLAERKRVARRRNTPSELDETRRQLRLSIEAAIAKHYRFETWMHADEATAYPCSEYYDGIKCRLVDDLLQSYCDKLG
ncbi:MAG: hypothetical protein AAFV38_14095 [Pseudomonadota bacterium]